MKVSFGRNYTSILLTVLFVVFLGAVYLFIYVPDNERRLQEQRFRTLQNINRNIHEKINNSVALMSNLIHQDTISGYIEYLNEQSKENFVIGTPVSRSDAATGTNTRVTDSGYVIKTDQQNRKLTLQLYKFAVSPSGDTLNKHTLEMKFSFNQFFKSLLPEYVFDGYVVFNDGTPIYETVSFGADLRDTVFGKAAKNLSTVRDYTIGGRDYKLFLQPISFIANNNWSVAGLLSKRRYLQERNQLPSNIILLLVTVMLAILISLPWVKLYQMGGKDRLTLKDGVASIAVAMLLMSLLFFSFFKYNTPLRPNDHTDSKIVLASEINKAFQTEIDTVYQKLHYIDSVVALNSSVYFKDFALGATPNVSMLNEDSLPLLSTLKKDTAFRQLLWLNGKGDETVNWTSEIRNAPYGNYQDRAYFKNSIQQDDYFLYPNQRFYLDQVISWTNGRFTSVLSIPSRVPGQSVAAISFTAKSLNSPVLPPGYQFALINKEGKVLYHSQPGRSLNENLITELSQKEKLLSALEAKTEDAFKTSYFGRDYNIYVRPIERLPYFIVVLSDLAYKETREIEIYSFTFSMLLLLFFIFILQLFIVFLISSKRSFFKKQLFDTSWVGPKDNSYDEYNLSIAVNLFVIFLATAFFPISSFLAYVFMLLFSVTFISIFLNSVFARSYLKDNQLEKHQFKINTRRWLIILLLIINVIALKALDWPSSILLLVYEIILVLAGFFFYYKGYDVIKNVSRFFRKTVGLKWNYKYSFSLMALTRLIITSGIPVAFFYVSAYNYEQNISIRYRQLQYANQLLNKLDGQRIKDVNFAYQFDRGYYKDNVWIKDIFIDASGPRKAHSEEDSITSKILDLFRLKFTDLAVKEDRFSVPGATDGSFGFNPLLKDACKKDSATITYVRLPSSKSYLGIKSAGLNYKLPLLYPDGRSKGVLFWLILLTSLVVFYFIIHNVIRKLFCLNLPNLTLFKTLDDRIIKNADVNNLLFIIGLPGSKKLSRVLDEIKGGTISHGDAPLVYNREKPEESNVCVADLINIPDLGDEETRNEVWQKFAKEHVFNDRNKLIIVNHFEYNIQDAITNRIKLNFLEQLMLENRCKIIILSTIHPVAFLDSVSDPTVQEKLIPGQDLERWHVLLGHYRIVVYPLSHQQTPVDADEKFAALYKETEHTHFLHKIQNCLIDTAKFQLEKGKPVRADEMIFKLQVTSHYFYMYIWQSLTKEEKFLLYDLAEDNLVNAYDDYNLNMLLAKGIIIRKNGTLTLFNRGFRNFILTAIGNNEAMKIKKQIKDNGNWNRLKTPLLIILAAILTFLLTSQKETYSELMAYIAALAAGIPAVLKFISLFDKNAQKE